MGRDRIEHAWNRGFDAGCKLLPLGSNPYKSGGRLFEAWEDGWRNGSAPDHDQVDLGDAARRDHHPGGSLRAVPGDYIGRRPGSG
ncbi:MAG: ribosome modulation factor [Limimaricola soesokkakensis]|uniref:ribosome modulation factor n=1 Tax=Limimaricola soesokkakensis TaxID=1343159 RepID=UPI00405892BC